MTDVATKLDEFGKTIAETPTDQLGYTQADPAIRAHFMKDVVASSEACERRTQNAHRMGRKAEATAAALKHRLDRATSRHKRARQELKRAENEYRTSPSGPAYEPTQRRPRDEEEQPVLRPRGQSLLKQILIVLAAVVGSVVDVYTFKSVLEILYATLTSEENLILAAGFSALTTTLAVGLGRSLAKAHRREGRQGQLASAVYIVVLLAMVITSFLIRAYNTSVAGSDVFGQQSDNTTTASPFASPTGWLPAAFFALIMVATALLTADEVRISSNPEYSAVRKAHRELVRAAKAEEVAIYRYRRAVGRLRDWLAEPRRAVVARDLHILASAADANLLFAETRRMVVQKVGDPMVTDAIAYAPTINLPDDLPPLTPPFQSVTAPPADDRSTK